MYWCLKVHQERAPHEEFDNNEGSCFVLSVWTSRGELCIFTHAQLRTWKNATLQNCPWFLECPLTFHHVKEKDERAKVGIVLGEDDDHDIVDAPKFHHRCQHRQQMQFQIGSHSNTWEIQSPPSLVLLPPHIENVAKVMAATLTRITCQRPQQLVRLAYANDKVEEGNEVNNENKWHRI